MLRLGDNMSDSREVLVDKPATSALADDDAISTSTPEVDDVDVTSLPATTMRENEPGAPPAVDTTTNELKLGVAGLRAANTAATIGQLSKSSTNNNRVEVTSTRSTANTVPVSTDRKQYGGRRRGQKSVVATIQETIEHVEVNAERDLISALGAKRTSHNLTYFVVLYSAVLCILAAFRAHLRGVEYHLGRKYFLSGSQLRLVTGVELVGIVASLAFVAVFGRRSHKPMLMFCGTLVCAVGSILCPVPYFVESARNGAPLHNVTTPTRDRLTANYFSSSSTTVGSSSNFSRPVPDMIEYFLTELCPTDAQNAWYSDPCVALNSTVSSTYGFMTYSTIAVGVLLHGVGTGMLITTGFIYVDENALNKAVPVYFGVLLSMSGFGEFIGVCIAWWFTSYNLHLTPPDNSLGVVAEWEYRAWWLGFVLLAVAMCCVAGLFLVYPKWIVEPEWVSTSRQRHIRQLQRLLDWHKEERRQRREQRKRVREMQRRYAYSLDASTSYQLGSADEMSHTVGANNESERRQSDTSSLASLAVTSLAGAKARQTSVAGNSAISSALTDETNVSWTGSAQLDKVDEDSCSDDDVMVAENDDDEDDDGGQSSMGSTCYSNPLFSINEEESDVTSSIAGSAGGPAAADYGGVSRSVRAVQFDVNDDEGRPARPEFTAVVTRDNKQSIFEKKFRELRNVVTVPVYTLSVIAALFAAFLLAGYRTNAARFVQLQYGYDYQHAWFYTDGLCFGLAHTIGPIVGGVIVHKFKLSRRRQLKMIITLLVVSTLLLLLLVSVSCPDAGFVWQNTTVTQGQNAAGSQRTWIESCSAKCSCSADEVGVQLQPVCTDDGRRYYSPCHAGCTLLQQTSAGTIEFSGCSCTGPVTHSLDCVSDCSLYGVYWFILFLAVISHSMTQVGVVTLFISSVTHKRRMLSLGFAVWIIVILAFVPGLALYRAIETSSCLDDMTQSDCHSEPICWRHDLDRYRYTTHGVTAAFQAVGVVLFVVALCLSSVSGDPDADDMVLSIASSRRISGIPLSTSAERRPPVSSDVVPGATSDITADVINVAAGQSLERLGSVYDTSF